MQSRKIYITQVLMSISVSWFADVFLQSEVSEKIYYDTDSDLSVFSIYSDDSSDKDITTKWLPQKS